MHGKLYNPYYLFFDIKQPYNSDIALYKNGLILVQHMKNEEYREFKEKTKFGQLIKNTPFENYAIKNNFLDLNNKNFIMKKTGNSKFSFAFSYKDDIFRGLV